MKNFASNSGAIAAFGLALGACAIAAPAASAYSGATAACAGPSIIGGGASLQKSAQTNFGADTLAVTPGAKFGTLATTAVATKGFGFAGAPGTACTTRRAAGKKIGYSAAGSGAGRKAWASDGVARDNTANFISSDEAPDTTEQSKMQTVGMKANTVMETIPVTQAAAAIIVNLPAGCTVVSTSRTATISNIEKAYWGTNSTWGQLLGSSALTPSSCASKIVTRTARLDSSGTSFALKNVLANTSGGSHWKTPTDYTSAANNTVWPATVTKPAATGGGALADLVNATAGSIGYVDLATARAKGFGFTGTTDTKFWLKVNAPAAGGTTVTNDPAKDAGQTPATFGANCGTARAYAGTPASTQSNWFAVTGAKATYAAGEYPICTLTYTFAYDKYSNFGIAGSTTFLQQTEPQARSVFDYANWITQSTGGQTTLAAADYQALPTALRTIAAAGAARINW